MTLAGRRIGLLTASASRAGGGVFEAVVTQAALIRSAGGEPVVFALADAHAAQDRARFGPTPVHVLPVRGPAPIGFAPGLVDALTAAELDLLHLHGIWMYPSRAGERWARGTGRPYLISPHGMLDRWITDRGRWKKALARIGYERASWARAATFHALTPHEAESIAAATGRQGALVIPTAAPAPSPGAGERRGVLFLSRIHPKKNIEALIEAWSSVASGEVLTIAGWGDPACLRSLEAAVAKAGAKVRFVGPVHGEAKQRLLAGARWLALPSWSEGLPVAVLEAWAAGTPTVMTAACHLPAGFATGAALACGQTVAAIAPVLATALAMPADEWGRRSAAARALAAGPFGVGAVRAQWIAAYADLLR